MHHKKEILDFLVFIFRICSTTDTTSPNQSLKDGDILVPSGETFAFGLFSPGKSRNRYVRFGTIKLQNQQLWVTNRHHPINGTFEDLVIDTAGNLVLSDENRNFSV